MPASKKIAGYLSHHAGAFCSLCSAKQKDMDNLDVDNWVMRTCEGVRASAFAWLNGNPDERHSIAQASGIRWSELYRLPYWDPTRQVVIDIMHNLFLGLIKRHFLVILGITDSVAKPGGRHLYQEPVPNRVREGRRLLNLRDRTSLSNALLANCNWIDLYVLHQECGITEPVSLKATKKQLANRLDQWVSGYRFCSHCPVMK
jgi:hypothetical protein